MVGLFLDIHTYHNYSMDIPKKAEARTFSTDLWTQIFLSRQEFRRFR